jgi:hypothetical protein
LSSYNVWDSMEYFINFDEHSRDIWSSHYCSFYNQFSTFP